MQSYLEQREAERSRVSETEVVANCKKLRRSSTYYENAKIECLTTNQCRQQENPTLATLLQQPKSSGNGVHYEDCNLWMLYLI